VNARQRVRWLAPTALVGMAFAATLLMLCGTALDAARAAPIALRFFDPRRSPTFDESCVVSAIDYALSSTEKNDVVFLGDSVCRTGIDPVQFESLTRLHAYNLGIVGDLGPDVMLNVAKAYLSRHPAPRLMVFCASPLGLERDVPEYWVKLRDHFVNCYGFDVHSLRSLERSLSYTFRQGTVLAWNRTASALTGLSHDVRDDSLRGMEQATYHQFERLTRQKRGYFELPGRGPYKNLDRPGGIVQIHPVWDSGLGRLAKTCENARVPLMIQFGPVSAEATKNLKLERPERWLQNLQTSYPHLVVPRDGKILRYPPDLCWDYAHPNPEGSRKFTERLAAEVRLALDSAGDANDK
jgi:hypothetical protein